MFATPVLALILAATSTATPAPTAVAAAPIPPGPPSTEVRLLAGTGVTVEAAQQFLNHRLRAELGLHAFVKGAWAEAAVLVRVLGSPSNALLVRAGAMAQSFPHSCGSDDATAVDLGLSYRHRWAGRSLFAAELGAESVSRTGGLCHDSVFPSASNGLRAALAGQYSFTPAFGVYARLGLRTAKHIPELGFLPEGWLGAAFEF